MAERVLLQHGKKTAAAKVPAESIERLLNGYLESVPDGKMPAPIYGTPGRVLWCDGLDLEPRGFVTMAEELYCVAGGRFYKIAADGTETNLGAIPGTDDVGIASDGSNIVIVAENEIYVWDGATLQAVTDPDAPNASSVAYTDGFFVFTETDTQQFFISGLQAPLDYDALDFASAEWKPDILVRAFVLRRTLYLFGTDSAEAQQNRGGADFPFAPYEDFLVDAGLIGTNAVTASNDAMFWVAPDRTIRRLDGITATRISNHDIERKLLSWPQIRLTVATSHVWEGHLFVVFRSPDGCVVFDQTTELWHDRASHNSTTWGVKHYAECYGLKLFGSATDRKIYRLENTAYDEDGEPLVFEMITPYAYDRGMRFSITEVEVMPQPGVGTLTLDPAITCEMSKDGLTWSTRRIRKLGKVGKWLKRVLFGQWGQARQMAFRFRITDPVKRAILGVYAEVEPE